MKKLVFGLAAIVIASAAAAQGAPQKYKIGALLAMSGAANWYGTVMSQGINQAVAEINAAGGVDGVPLEVVIEDHKSGNAQEAVSAMNRLITLHGVSAVMTSFSVPTQAVAPIADQRRILLWNGGGVSTALVGASKYIYHNRSLASDLGRAALQHAETLGAKRLAALQMKNDTGDSIANAAHGDWKKRGHELLTVEAVPVGVKNIDTQVAKIRAARPDVVGLWMSNPEVGLALRRLRESGVTVPAVGIEFTENDAKIAGPHAEGFYYVADHFQPSADNPWSQKFATEYQRRNGAAPEFYAANYYEGVYAIAEIFKRARAKGGDFMNADVYKRVIEEKPQFDSVYGGRMTFQPNGIAFKRVGLFRVEGGQGKFLKYVDIK